MRWLALVALAAGCGSHHREDFGPAFYAGVGERVVCSKGVDRDHEWKMPRLVESLTTARVEAKTLVTFGHAPGQWSKGVDLVELEPAFAWARDHNLPFVTMRELAHGYRGAGWAFTIDDNEVDTWTSWLPTFKKYDMRVTFFVTKLDDLTPAQKAALAAIAAAGHDIEAHGKTHADAKQTVATAGLAAYLKDEIAPNLDGLRAAGYQPVAFAYPYGAHAKAIDDALLAQFTILRTTGAEHCTVEREH